MLQTDIIIVDYGSQYTLLIERKLNEQGIRTKLIQTEALSAWQGASYKGIILSGGPASSCQGSEIEQLPSWVFEARRPILGICLGMHLLTHSFSGEVSPGQSREYGKSTIHFEIKDNKIAQNFLGLLETKQDVWMSHGDCVTIVPSVFDRIAQAENGVVAAIAHKKLPFIGVQFHPEVFHTKHGVSLLKNFACNHCQIECESSHSLDVSYILQDIRRQVGNGRVLLAVSGGVDSTVMAVLLSKALPAEQVTCVLIDQGLMRKNECKQVLSSFRKIGISLHCIDESEFFLRQLKGLSDPESKRKTVGRAFVEAFERFSKACGPFTHLGQGTLFPDIIESAGFGTKAKVIKSHHNVGGLPDRLQLKLIEPLRYMFKDEVRHLGALLNIPTQLLDRHPFPGPGLAIRVVGDVSKEKIKLLQDADEIFISSLKANGYYDHIWQAGAILLPVKSVGVMGDNRTYEWTCVLRAVCATDAMTAEVGELPLPFLTTVASQIIRQVKGINRVLYDITSKPPATIEWE